jgi:hypothetical protein
MKLSKLLNSFIICIVTAAVFINCSDDGRNTISETPIVFPKIDRNPKPANYSRGSLTALPAYNLTERDGTDMDLRSYDLSGLDLSDSLNDLLSAEFDDMTIWPASDKMPAGFDRKTIVEYGKDPGLNVKTLHGQGIAGKNIGIAIMDNPLLTGHTEYRERLRLYEEINILPTQHASMHGSAVASIAAGSSIGVAPEADLYFIAVWSMYGPTKNSIENYKCYTQAINRILDVNKQLPNDRKIKVISISKGFSPVVNGYSEVMDAITQAKNAGIFVVCSNTFDAEFYGFNFFALGRDPLLSPNDINSYRPGLFWEKNFFENYSFYQNENMIMAPMDSRTTASETGNDNYVFYRKGGLSWSIPYIAGVYALACQVKPTITPEEFCSLALSTGDAIDIVKDGETYHFGKIINPVKLIQQLQ